MSKYKRYERYKDSGVEWIGEIPEHWEISKLKYLTYCLDGKRIPLSSEQRGEMQGDIPYWGANCIIDYVNDWLIDGEVVLLGEDGAPFFDKYKDVAFYSNEKIWPNNHVHVLRALQSINVKLLTYILNTVDYSNYIKGSTRDKLTQSEMKNIFIQLPPVKEQKTIANFLDQKTTEIDNLIADKEKLIELLQEKRQAIITEAVTKGLNPNVKMKDSGVEWIGEIPEHWDVIKLKYVTKLVYGDSLPTENREEGEVDVFGSNGKVGTHNVANTISPVIIVGRKGSYGKVTYSDKKCFAIDTTYYIDNRCTKSNIKWLYYSLMVLELDKNSQDTGVPGLSREYAYNKYVPVPTVNEQVAIANFLDQKTAEIDDLIFDIYTQIQKLKEYRQSLISEAVTGKIDVREFGNMSEVIYYEQNNSPCSEFTHAAE